MGDTGPGSSSRQEEKLNTLADVLSEDSAPGSTDISEALGTTTLAMEPDVEPDAVAPGSTAVVTTNSDW